MPYRRYFSLRRTGCPQKRILTRAQLLPLLDTADIFLPKKRHYWLETNFTQYAHAHHEEDLWKARAALARLHPGQEHVFDRVMARRSGHRFNLMLMRRDALQSYASWLFPLLDAAEIDTTGYSARDKRVHGFLAERLLDVWLAQQDYRVKELPVAHLERQHWGRKIAAFLLRKMGIKNDRTAR